MKWLFLLLLVACDTTTESAPDHTLQLHGGGDQIAGFGEVLAEPVAVRLAENGRPVSGEDVRWRVIGGGGSVSEIVTVSDAQGIATVLWHLGEDEVDDQLLLATWGNASLTIRASGQFAIASVSVGYQHACALSSQRKAFCWGDNTQFQLGDGTNVSRTMPTPVTTDIRFSKVTAGWSHTCGLATGGAVYCWGDNSVGQLGIPTALGGSAIPVALSGNDGFRDIAAGFIHTCGVTVRGDKRCWGSDAQGQTGGPTVLGELRQITAGEFHSCGLRADGAGMCWGWNTNGQLGTNSSLGAIVPPTSTYLSTTFTQIAAGVRHTCGVQTDTRVYCWGRNAAGENGQDPGVQTSVPVAVQGSQNYTAVTAGNLHSCGLRMQNAYCWGLGLGKVPVPLEGSLRFSMIDAGFDRTCGVADGEVWCWNAGSVNATRIAFR